MSRNPHEIREAARAAASSFVRPTQVRAWEEDEVQGFNTDDFELMPPAAPIARRHEFLRDPIAIRKATDLLPDQLEVPRDVSRSLARSIIEPKITFNELTQIDRELFREIIQNNPSTFDNSIEQRFAIAMCYRFGLHGYAVNNSEMMKILFELEDTHYAAAEVLAQFEGLDIGYTMTNQQIRKTREITDEGVTQNNPQCLWSIICSTSIMHL